MTTSSVEPTLADMKTNAIGLDGKKAAKLAEKLNVLLANYSVFYQNTRGYHWNIKGEKFFEGAVDGFVRLVKEFKKRPRGERTDYHKERPKIPGQS